MLWAYLRVLWATKSASGRVRCRPAHKRDGFAKLVFRADSGITPLMNEQNPPPDHLAEAEYFQKVQLGILAGCLVILLYLLVALDSANLLVLLMVLVFLALPLTVTFFVVDGKVKYWEKPFQLYSREFSYKPKLTSGVQVPIQVEYQFPTEVNTSETLESIHATAASGIDNFYSCLSNPSDYEETRRLLVQVLSPEIERLGIEVFRIHIVKIQYPSQRYSFSASFHEEPASIDAPRSLAARAT
jgi:hypothetical protein